MRKWTFYLLHHSHTDIGYTDTQDEITAEHISYLREAIRLASQPENASFRWICETLWSVERFLDVATQEEKRVFAELCKENKIGLSGSYLNMTEAICKEAIIEQTNHILLRLKEMGFSAAYAVTSDVNGYAWGYADLLAVFGVKGLISQINATFGDAPFTHRQTPFVWEGPEGNRITVWIAEHYNQGNWLSLAPNKETPIEDALTEAKEKVNAYILQLEDRGYPYDFAPIGISGFLGDNAPPNAYIATFAKL